jgi:hypothetical protein
VATVNALGQVIDLIEQLGTEVSKRLGTPCEINMSLFMDGTRRGVRVMVLGPRGKNAQALISEAAAPFTTAELLVESLITTAETGRDGVRHP